MNRFSTRTVLWIAAVLALSIGCLEGTALSQGKKVVAVSWGGDYQTALREAYWKPFEQKIGIKVIEDTLPNPSRVKAMVESGNIQWDLLDLTESQYMQTMADVGAAKAFEAIDYKKIDPESLRFIDRKGQKPNAVMHQTASTGIAYRTDAFKGDRPRNWADFWDVKQFPGLRALRTVTGAGASGTIEAALLADGVPMDKLYPLDVERAFRKLSALKPHVIKWTTTAAMPQQLLVDKEAVMVNSFSARAFAIQQKGAPIEFVWNQAMIDPMYLVIPKGSPNKGNALLLIDFMLKEENQARYGNIYYYGVANKKAYEKILPSRRHFLSTYSENLKVQFYQDAEWWAKNGAKVIDRWNEWVLK